MPSTPLGFHGIRFLVIDRDAEVLRSVERHLQFNAAPAVHTVEAVLPGLDILKDPRNGINCILCAEDVTPILGIEFLKNLRGGKYGDDENLRGTKFILLTAHREKTLVNAAVNLDVHGYIVKPFDQLTLTRGIHKALAHHVNLKPRSAYFNLDISSAIRLPVWLAPP